MIFLSDISDALQETLIPLKLLNDLHVKKFATVRNSLLPLDLRLFNFTSEKNVILNKSLLLKNRDYFLTNRGVVELRINQISLDLILHMRYFGAGNRAASSDI